MTTKKPLRPDPNRPASATDFIAEAITDFWGVRCPDYAEGCACCAAWKQYDELKSFPRKSGQGHARP